MYHPPAAGNSSGTPREPALTISRPTLALGVLGALSQLPQDLAPPTSRKTPALWYWEPQPATSELTPCTSGLLCPSCSHQQDNTSYETLWTPIASCHGIQPCLPVGQHHLGDGPDATPSHVRNEPTHIRLKLDPRPLAPQSLTPEPDSIHHWASISPRTPWDSLAICLMTQPHPPVASSLCTRA